MAPNTGNMSNGDAVAASLPARHLAPAPLLEQELVIDAVRGQERAGLLSRILAVADLAAAVCAGGVATVAAQLPGEQAWPFLGAIAVLWFAVAFAAGLYQFESLGDWASGIPTLGRMAGAGLFVSWPLVAVAALLGAEQPIVAALAATTAVVGLWLGGRTTARAALHRIAPLRQRTLIVGSGVVAARLAERLRRHAEFGLEPIGLVDDDVHAVPGEPVPVLGSLADLGSVLDRHRVDRVVIAFSRTSHEQMLAAMRACREKRVALDVVPRLFEFLDGARAVESIGGLPVLSIGAHRLSRSSAAAKRALDVALSSALLALLAPLFAVIAAAIKLDSRGPVFFRQPRAGRAGEPFQLVKFRSMHVNADEAKVQLAERNELPGGVMFKMRRDPRVSRVGSVLRRLSLDELPQLLNVLRGDMSIVGPRPLVLPESEALIESWHARRLDLRPGMTGPWQISGRSDLSADEMVRLDFQYVTGWSLARDLEIILATLPAVLSGRGAY